MIWKFKIKMSSFVLNGTGSFCEYLRNQNPFRNSSIVSVLPLQNGTGGVHNEKVLTVRHANSVSLEQGCCDPARSTAIE